MFLLDTNVVSELRKFKTGRANPNVVAWVKTVQKSNLFLSAIVIAEIEVGILRVERKDPAQGTILRNWFNTYVLFTFTDRILPVDTAVAMCNARLHIPDPMP
jgi:predicted nucleic acid-binding protein